VLALAGRYCLLRLHSLLLEGGAGSAWLAWLTWRYGGERETWAR